MRQKAGVSAEKHLQWKIKDAIILRESIMVTEIKSGLASPLFSVQGDAMSKRETYEEKTESLLSPIVERFGVEIYDVEYVKEGKEYYLRVYIDKPEGVNIQDCENVSRALSDALDEEEFIPDAYILEVSSPGLGRVLKKDRHLEKSLGEAVELKTYKPIEKKKEFAGILKAYDASSVTIEEEGVSRTFERADIATVRLALDF